MANTKGMLRQCLFPFPSLNTGDPESTLNCMCQSEVSTSKGVEMGEGITGMVITLQVCQEAASCPAGPGQGWPSPILLILSLGQNEDQSLIDLPLQMHPRK